MKYLLFIISIILFPLSLQGQCFLTGADLSYVNEIVKEGGKYYDASGVEVEPFEYFANKETKIVRLRLWHTPSNNISSCGNAINSSNLTDVLEAAIKIKQHGMQLKLSIHYSDYFADPGKQKAPKAWEGLSHSTLLDSITNYTEDVLGKLLAQNTLPDIVSIGNETTWGFIDATANTNGWDWNTDADKFNAAFDAIDLFNQAYNTEIKKAIHITEETALWAANEFVTHGVANFDIIGVSYYPFFSPSISLNDLGEIIKDLHSNYGKEIMIFETGFAWSNGFSDNYNNFINNNGSAISSPMSAQGQKDFLIELSKTVLQNNGTGVIYWEPAWITSSMCDLWGQGSSYENVTLFDTGTQEALVSFDFFKFCNLTSSTFPENRNDVRVYPNPLISSELKIEIKDVDAKWNLYDLDGKLLLQDTFENGGLIKTIDLSSLSEGVYYLSIQSSTSEFNFIKKLLIL